MTQKQKIAKKTVNEDGTITVDFSNGETRLISPKEFPKAIQAQALGFGFSTKLGNAYASNTGVADAVASFDALHTQLMDGVWNLEGVGGIKVEDIVKVYIAIATDAGKTVDVDTFRTKVLAMEPEERTALRKDKRYKTKKAELDLASAQGENDSETDLDSLF